MQHAKLVKSYLLHWNIFMPISLTQEMKEKIANALDENYPVLISTVDQDLSRNSTAVRHSPEQEIEAPNSISAME